MKKSDMVKIIEEAMQDNYDATIEEGWFINCEEVLNRILDEGMLPPLNKKLAKGRRHEFAWNVWEQEPEEEL